MTVTAKILISAAHVPLIALSFIRVLFVGLLKQTCPNPTVSASVMSMSQFELNRQQYYLMCYDCA